MKTKLLVASFDLEVGGVERSLINLLSHLDYNENDVDVMLYRHQGDFFKMLPPQPKLLSEIPEYSTFRKSIGEIFKEKHYWIGLSRLFAKLDARLSLANKRLAEPGYYQMQKMWTYTLPFLPKLAGRYDVAISFLWPHYFVAEKVSANKKIAWIHTDYATIETNISVDLKMWRMFDKIVAVSEACQESFLKKYPELTDRVCVIENLASPEFIKKMAMVRCKNPLLDDERFKMVTVARLSHAKGIDRAVQALKTLKDKGVDNLAWYVVGYGGDEGKLKELINSLDLEDCFFLLGKQTNPYPFMLAADLYVQPSRYEGKAVTVTEAQILGKPVLITNYLTAKSQIDHGKDGLICEQSIEGLAAGIERLVFDEALRNQLQRHVRCKDFSNKRELERLSSLIRGEDLFGNKTERCHSSLQC